MRKFLSLFLVLFTLTFTFTLTCSADTLSDEILAQGKAEADLFLTLKQALGLDWIDEYNAYLSDPTTNPAPAWDTTIASLVSQGYLPSSFPTDFTITLSGQEVKISRKEPQQSLREAMAIYLPTMTVTGTSTSTYAVNLLVQRPDQWVAYETALDGKVDKDGSDNPDILPNASLDFGSNSQINFVSNDGRILGVNSLFYKTQELDNRFVNITGDTMTGVLTATGFKVGTNNVWHQGNDGTGSGMDADLLDGQDSAFYRDATNINAGTLNPARLSGTYGISITGNAATATNADKLDGQDSVFYRNASNLNAGTVPTGRLSGTYGIDISGKAATAGNAEKLDGRDSTQFAYISDTYSATVSSAGWYTIATVPTGRAFAEFYVWDTSTSGRHNSVKLIASTSFGKNNIAVINGNSSGPRSIAHARILYKTSDRTYGGAKLQVYCENPSYTLNVRSTMDKQMTGWTGWNVITPVKEDTPSGWAEDTITRREDITNYNYAFVGNVKGDITGKSSDSDKLGGQLPDFYQNASNINAGTLNPARLSGTYGISITGNAATASKLATARTIALAGNASGSASFDGSGNITINTTVSHATNADTADTVDGKHYSDLQDEFVNVTGDTMTGSLIADVDVADSVDTRIYKNLASYRKSTSITGTLKITLPKPWSNTMMRIRIVGYNYSGTTGSWEVITSGYNYSSGWINHSAEIRGKAPFSQVRLGYDGSKCVILLGDTSTVWSYPHIVIEEMLAGHSSITGWETGWTMGVITSESGITNIVTPAIQTMDNYVKKSGDTMTGELVAPGFKVGSNIVWHQGNDGTGSGLDADLLDGQDSAFYQNASNLNAGTVPTGRLSGTYNIGITGNAATATNADQLDGQHGAFYQNASNLNAGTVPTGRLSGTYGISITGNAATANHANDADYADDADKLDGLSSERFLASRGNKLPPSKGRVWTVGEFLSLAPGTYMVDQNISATEFGLPVDDKLFNLIIFPPNGAERGTAMILFRNGPVYIFNKHSGYASDPMSPSYWKQVWHSGSDGSGSGLDADLLDGQDSAFYRNASNINAGTLNSARLSGTYGISITGNAATATTASNSDQLDGYHHDAFVKRAGDTMTGRLGLSASGIRSAQKDNIATRTDSGFFWTGSATTGEGWPINGSYMQLLTSTFYSDGNYYSMQFASPHYDQRLYFRQTHGSGTTAWNTVWHSGSDGSGSGLDADLLDGQHGAFYQNASNLNTGIVPTSRLSGTYGISISGNAATASKLATARTIALAGNASGSASFDGSGNVTINTTVSQAANADTVDNKHYSDLQNEFVNVTGDTMTGRLAISENAVDPVITNRAGTDPITAYPQGISIEYLPGTAAIGTGFPSFYGTVVTVRQSDTRNFQLFHNKNSVDLYVRSWKDVSGGVWTDWQKIWNAGNDGTGSGMDADLLDGQNSAFYRDATNINAGTLNPARLSGTYGISITGNAATASKLATARTIALAGNASGSASFDGSGNVTINTTVSQAANADTVDGKHYSDLQGEFVKKAGDTMTGDLAISKNKSWFTLKSSSSGDNDNEQAAGISIGEAGKFGGAALHITYTGDGFAHIGMGTVSTAIPAYEAIQLKYTDNIVRLFATPTVNGSAVWHAGNDGAGSGMNADLLDGQHGAFYQNASNLNTGVVPAARLSGTYNISISGNAATATTASNSDKLDGYHHDAFVKRAGDTMTGALTAPEYRINDANTKLVEGSRNSVRVQTNYGYTEIGPQNEERAHFYTDRPEFYFSKPVKAETQIQIYGTNTYLTGTEGKIAGNTVWHAGNDGSNSGLDADMLDGKHASELGGLIPNGVKQYSTPGTYTWTKNPGTRYVFVQVVGGGGGGSVDWGSALVKGGTSSFGSYCYATGGDSGRWGKTHNPGYGVGGDINITGGRGGHAAYGGWPGSSALSGFGNGGGGRGEHSVGGSAGGYAAKWIDVSGVTSVTVTVGAGSNAAGGIGESGVVIVEEFK